jgi:penicillin-insensitive murein endopeptidase
VSRRRRAFIFLAGFAVLGWTTWFFGNDALRLIQADGPSIAHGSTGAGSLENGKRLPTNGVNFRAYSRLGALLGRNSVHSTVRDILLETFSRMGERSPGIEMVYGETGWPGGGPFPPHRTHQNGSSVDLFVPVLRGEEPAVLPTRPWNKFGYSIEFDDRGRWGSYEIDFETVAIFLLVLQTVAEERGAPITRVILAPEFVDELQMTDVGRQAVRSIPWMRGRPWVRHDEHFHVDFAVAGSSGVN